ncbi:MAG: hypothetical protein IJR72_06025 [Oscillospiraceae bacterium]|nr:hypothetical protein [Oscillospiraceae bacterium]
MVLSLLKKPLGVDAPPGGNGDTRPVLKWKLAYGHMPVKRAINFATVGEKPIDWRIAIPSIMLIIVLAGLISKVAVLDRFAELNAARAEVYAIQNEIREKQAQYDNFADISIDYAHYTISDMSTEERERISRVTVMETVQQIILPVAPLDAWTLHENTLSIHISSNTLTEVTDMVAQLQASPAVSSCSIVTASTTVSSTENISTSETITAEVSITFKNASTIRDEAKAAEEAQKAAAEAEASQQEGGSVLETSNP